MNRKDLSPTVFKTLHFLLMYLESDSDGNSLRARETNDELIRQFLEVTKNGPILEVHDLMVVLRYFSSPALLDYCRINERLICSEKSSSSICKRRTIIWNSNHWNGISGYEKLATSNRLKGM